MTEPAIATGVLLLLWVAALAQLIYHLAKSYAAIRLTDASQRGFEPLGVRPATAVVMAGTGPSPAPAPPPAAGGPAVTPPPPDAKVDPARPLHLAVRSTRLLGIVSALLGLIVIVAFGYRNRFPQFRLYFIGGGLLIWFVPGVLYLTCSVFLARRSRAAALVALATAALQALFAIGLFVASVTLEPVSPIPVILAAALWPHSCNSSSTCGRASARSARDAEHVRGFDLNAPPRACCRRRTTRTETKDDVVVAETPRAARHDAYHVRRADVARDGWVGS